jgi:hypothetical protein
LQRPLKYLLMRPNYTLPIKISFNSTFNKS